jgi:hypothetical protein
MLYWIIQITLISIILIFLVHYLINFFKSTLTVPKIKDLVNTSPQKYENIYNIISSNSYDVKTSNANQKPDEYTLIDLLPVPEKEETTMKNELKDFLKQQLHNTSRENNVNPLDSLSNMDSIANY